MKGYYFLIICTIFILLPSNSIFGKTESSPFQIPKIEDIVIDGNDKEWGERGFRVEFLADPEGRVLPADDFDVRFRLGWNENGLNVLVFVRDDVPIEHENASRLWRQDCIEIFCSEAIGSNTRYQLVLASGADSRFGTLRKKLHDWRLPRDKKNELSVNVAASVSENGYILEVLLPWENINFVPEINKELAFQLVANDYDGSDDESGSMRVAWFSYDGPRSRTNFYRLILSNTASPAYQYRLSRTVEMGRCTITVNGVSELDGALAELKSGDKTVALTTIKKHGVGTHAQFTLKSSEYQEKYPDLELLVNSRTAAFLPGLPSLDWIVKRYLQALGGRVALEKLKTRECCGEYVDDMPTRTPPVHPCMVARMSKLQSGQNQSRREF